MKLFLHSQAVAKGPQGMGALRQQLPSKRAWTSSAGSCALTREPPCDTPCCESAMWQLHMVWDSLQT